MSKADNPSEKKLRQLQLSEEVGRLDKITPERIFNAVIAMREAKMNINPYSLSTYVNNGVPDWGLYARLRGASKAPIAKEQRTAYEVGLRRPVLDAQSSIYHVQSPKIKSQEFVANEDSDKSGHRAPTEPEQSAPHTVQPSEKETGFDASPAAGEQEELGALSEHLENAPETTRDATQDEGTSFKAPPPEASQTLAYEERCDDLSKRMEGIRARIAKTVKEPRAVYKMDDLNKLADICADLRDKLDTLKQRVRENPSNQIGTAISSAQLEVKRLEESYWSLYKIIIALGRRA